MVNDSKIPFSQKFLVGAVAGISGTTIVYPLDIIKTKIQSNRSTLSSSIVTETINVAKSIVTTNGLKGLYRGFSSCLVGIAPEKAIKLAVNDTLKEKGYNEVIAGSVAGVLQLSVTVPYELVKIRLQMQSASEVPLTGREIVSSIIKKEGIPGLYRGITACFYRDIPFCVLFFSCMSRFQEMGLSSLPAGMLAGAISGGIVTPMDMLKTRIQQGLSGNKGVIEYAKEVATREGYVSLYKGYHTRVMVIAPLYGLVSLAFDVQKRFLSQHQ